MNNTYSPENLTQHKNNCPVQFPNSTYIEDPDNVVGIVGGSLMIVTICAGIPGNLLVILSILLNRHLRYSYSIYILGLTGTDLLMNCIVIPFYLDPFLHRRWRFSITWCKIVTYVGAALQCSAPFHLGCIAINRYFSVVFPNNKFLLSKRMAAIKLACVWILCFLLILPGMLGVGAKIGYSDRVGRCNYIRKNSRFSVTLIVSVGLVSPIAIMAFCYIGIIRRLYIQDKIFKQETNKGNQNRKEQNTVENSNYDNGNINEQNQKSTNHNTKNIYKTPLKLITVLSIAYMVTYFPFAVVNLADRCGSFPRAAYMITGAISWSSTCLNCVLYGAVNRKYRRAYRMLLCRWCRPLRKSSVNMTASEEAAAQRSQPDK